MKRVSLGTRAALFIAMASLGGYAVAGFGDGGVYEDHETLPNYDYQEKGFYMGKNPGSEVMIAITDDLNPFIAVYDRGTDRI